MTKSTTTSSALEFPGAFYLDSLHMLEFNGHNQEDFLQLLTQVNNYLSYDSPIDSFRVLRFDGKTLTICGSSDETYRHDVELRFRDVFHFHGDHAWTRDPEFTTLQILDSHQDRQSEIDHRLLFTLFSLEPHFHNQSQRVEIWAKGFEFNTDTVLYHKKENLAPGERLADWLLD